MQKLNLGLAMVWATVWASAAFCGEPSIDEKLSALPGVSAKELFEQNVPADVRVFEIQFTQPVDHDHPQAGSFEQKLILLHRDESEPMVLQTSGYSIFSIRPTAIMQTFRTNQLQVEHRYFDRSTPSKVDWSKLNIKQSADDFHSVVETFKKIYTGRWVNTGASKGGMTSVYHRRFYPQDLDGTVADVAPLSFSKDDPRYVDFVESVGGERYAACRAKLKVFQKELLSHRSELVPTLKGDFSHLGSADVAFEHAVIEAPFIFWQYGDPDSDQTGCDQIPVGESPKKQLEFLNSVNSIGDYANESLTKFFSYYFQAGTQLGSPANGTAHLQGLTLYPFAIEQYFPKGAEGVVQYSNDAMLDVDRWVRNQATDLLFIYGAFDPWSAGAFPLSETGKNVQKLIVPRGNHGSKFVALPEAAKVKAVEQLSHWLGKAPVSSEILFGESDAPQFEETLEDVEFRYRRTLHL